MPSLHPRPDPKIVSSVEAMLFWCPLCRAQPADPCRRVGDGAIMKMTHRERRKIALAARTITARQRQQLVLWLASHASILWKDS